MSDVEQLSCDWQPHQRNLHLQALPATYAPVSWQTIPTLADLTTLGVGGAPASYSEADSTETFIEALRDLGSEPLLVIGGGSNIIAADDPFPGHVLRPTASSYHVSEDSACGGVIVRVDAGMPWDEFVTIAIEHEWMGLEALSGIPGTVGAAPVQNIGAYGHEVAETISSVFTIDRTSGQRKQFALADMGFGYRNSVLKRSIMDANQEGTSPSPRWIVTQVEFQFRHASLSAPILYGQLARTLGVNVGERVDAKDVRDAVIELRRSKGMVLDPADPDTRSAGSFFTNPILDHAQAQALPEEAPRYPVVDHTRQRNIADEAPVVEGKVKTSAAWLIDHAGFSRGYRVSDSSPVSLSTKHVLALTRQGKDATSRDLAVLAHTIQRGVKERFGIDLHPEPVQVGKAL